MTYVDATISIQSTTILHMSTRCSVSKCVFLRLVDQLYCRAMCPSV